MQGGIGFISSIILYSLIALALSRVNAIVTGQNYNATTNGFGAISGVLNRTGSAPQVYRALVPWLIGAFEKVFGYNLKRRLILYEVFKFLLIWTALCSIGLSCGINCCLIVASILALTFHFDYWDWAVELAAFAACLSGNLYWAMAGATLLALSRETCWLCAPIYYFVTHNYVEAAGVLGVTWAYFSAVRAIQGHHALYCNRIYFKRNMQEVRRMFLRTPWFLGDIFMSLVITFATLWACWMQVTAWPVALALLVAGWVFGLASETRIFTATLLWIGMALCA